MGAKQREYRGRIRSTSSMKKIFSARELIATSRIAKARARVHASEPYATAITKAASALASHKREMDHPLLTERERVTRAAVLILTSDAGMAGAYSANVLRTSDQLIEWLRERDVEPAVYMSGRKGAAFYRFRRRPTVREWSGFSEEPRFDQANEIGDVLIDAFLSEDPAERVDEIHVVYTKFISMVRQEPIAVRMLPLEVVETDEPAVPKPQLLPLYEFEPNPDEALERLLPRYINSRLFNAYLQAAASEHAARQRAMKSASDNAEELINKYTRLANQARQAEITQEISEIVGGADALAATGTD
ncbi:MAG: F0F1 ATP synthase subunit gamma [Micrococcales bacterium]|nr:MAG: F0F1 ATP synthase subunit gamma [Micrococcales bacterium]PIE27659.1 MAG: F0F1 ATP synthase subunit gamma [Micrococcales bacterium]